MAGNPSPWPMKDATNNDSLHNHGFETTSAGRPGQKFIRPFGLDRSTEVGSAQHERDVPRGMGGGVDNLAHSLRGASANQTGKSRG